MLPQFWKKIISNLEFYIQTNYQSSMTSTMTHQQSVTKNNLPPTHHFKKKLEDVLHQKQGEKI